MAAEPPQRQSDEQKSALVEQVLRRKLSPGELCRRYGLTRHDFEEWVRVYRREAHRAVDERLRAELSRQGLDLGDFAAEFSGNVGEMALGELIQTIQFGRRDASIRVEHDDDVGHIWCMDGEIVDAEASHLKGVAAVYRLLALERGRIYASYSPVQRVRNVKVSTQALLMEGARRVDEGRRLRDQLGDTSAIYVPSGLALAPNVQATPAQFGVLRLFDGMRSIEQVVQASHSPDLETLGHIARLLDGGLLELSLDAPAATEELEAPTHALSFLPFAASLGVPPSPRRQRRFAWTVAAIGAGTLTAVLALRFFGADKASSGAPNSGASNRSTPGAVTQTTRAARASPGSLQTASCHPEAAPIAGAGGAPPLCLGRREVTVAAYAACNAAGGCTPAGKADVAARAMTAELRRRSERAMLSLCNLTGAGRDDHPINCVTQHQARAYCQFRGGRLPTDAEWELALRGDSGRQYPWGSAPPDSARLNACGAECKSWHSAAGLETSFADVMYDGDDGFAATAPVGSFPRGASSEGIDDLLGNVAEWTASRVDFFDADAERGAVQGRAPESFIVRGGSFSSGGEALEAPRFKLYLGASRSSESVGFRCAYGPGR